MCLLTICEGKGHRSGFCHSPGVLSYLAITNLAAGFSKVLKITAPETRAQLEWKWDMCFWDVLRLLWAAPVTTLDHFRYQVMCKCNRTCHVVKPLLLGFPFHLFTQFTIKMLVFICYVLLFHIRIFQEQFIMNAETMLHNNWLGTPPDPVQDPELFGFMQQIQKWYRGVQHLLFRFTWLAGLRNHSRW